MICADNPFSYSFAAEDKDGDELSYSLCDAYSSSNFLLVSTWYRLLPALYLCSLWQRF